MTAKKYRPTALLHWLAFMVLAALLFGALGFLRGDFGRGPSWGQALIWIPLKTPTKIARIPTLLFAGMGLECEIQVSSTVNSGVKRVFQQNPFAI